jgi:hypothetical protein
MNGAMPMSREPIKHPPSFSADKLSFLGEQDGPFERIFKEQLEKLFKSSPDVRRAYLVQLRHSSDPSVSIALALRTAVKETPEFVAKLGSVFESTPGVPPHLELLFLDEPTEREVRKVCHAFYERADA